MAVSPKPRPGATQADIARHLGIGQKTVSRVFLQPDLVREDLRARVLATARRLGYRPNAGARAMRSGRFRTVILVRSTNRVASPLPEDLLTGIEESLGRAGLSLLLERMPDEDLVDEDRLPRLAREVLADGLLLNYDTNIPATLVDLITRQGLPAVWINSRQKRSCVRPDDAGGARDLCRTLIGLGHRRILYADFHLRRATWLHYSREDRRDGYRQAMAEAGLETDEILPQQVDLGIDLARRILDQRKPTAVIGYGDQEAAAFLTAALATGRSLPDDLSLATFGARTLVLGRPVATWLVPQLAMGRQAADELLARIAGRRRRAAVVLPFSSDHGTTLGPARS